MKQIAFTEGLKLAAIHGVVSETSDNSYSEDCCTTIILGNGDKLIFQSEYDSGYYIGGSVWPSPTCWHEPFVFRPIT